MKNFWQKLPKPFFCLAPMEGVTDTVFRQIVTRWGRPDVLFTEFVSVEGLCSPGHDRVKESLDFLPEERPLIAQIWGTTPEYFENAARKIVELGFDGVDINYGCPVRTVVTKGACSAMIKTPNLAVEIIKATQQGANNQIPVSVKTRIGFKEIVTESWAETLLKTGIDALTIHARTAEELSKVPARWEEVGKVVAVRDALKLNTVIIGNGDVLSVDQGKSLADEYKVDGIMIGRGIFYDPWLFNNLESILSKNKQEKLTALAEHTELFVKYWGTGRGFERMKRFVKIYIQGFKGSAELRDEFMRTKTYMEFYNLLNSEL